MPIEPREPNFTCDGTLYTVQSGDTMYFIARRYGVTLQNLIDANPHISNPSLIYPGDVLCVPSEEPPTPPTPRPPRPPEAPAEYPCTLLLEPTREDLEDVSGVAYIQEFETEEDDNGNELIRYAITVFTFDLPEIEDLGNFSVYEGIVNLPEELGGSEFLLAEAENIADEIPILVGSTTIELEDEIPDETRIIIRPSNPDTGTSGRSVLANSLQPC